MCGKDEKAVIVENFFFFFTIKNSDVLSHYQHEVAGLFTSANITEHNVFELLCHHLCNKSIQCIYHGNIH